jgi:hypothetical protein
MLQLRGLFHLMSGEYAPRSRHRKMEKSDRELASLAMTAAMV